MHLFVVLLLCAASVPGCKGLKLVVGEVQHSEVTVSRQQWDTLVCQAVIGQIELLQAAKAVI